MSVLFGRRFDECPLCLCPKIMCGPLNSTFYINWGFSEVLLDLLTWRKVTLSFSISCMRLWCFICNWLATRSTQNTFTRLSVSIFDNNTILLFFVEQHMQNTSFELLFGIIQLLAKFLHSRAQIMFFDTSHEQQHYINAYFNMHYLLINNVCLCDHFNVFCPNTNAYDKVCLAS